MKSHPDKGIIIWLYTGCALVFLMVLIGGITRLTESGLSMVDWKLVSGSIPPLNEQEWNDAFDRYKQFPEYQIKNTDFTLSDFKSIFWWEFIHRLLGRLIGLVFIVPFIYFVAKKRIKGRLFKQLCFLLLLGGMQGLIGWYMVKSGLVNQPDVSHLRLALHLITAFITFGFTQWIAISLIYTERRTGEAMQRLNKWLRALFLLLVVQIIYGAFVAGLNAGLYYNTFPKMGDQWIPDELLYLQPWYMNFIEHVTGVQFAHRLLAYVISAMVLLIYVKIRRTGELLSMRPQGNTLLAILMVQVGLGIFTLLYAVPIALGVLHQIGAFFLFAMTIYFIRVSAFGKLT